ncbi:hypothetical protein [Empedobacter sp. UBA6745]|uniref:hypothetical protein n=1 Tax=Empedobacter sp. UBA6745 TaxID=1946447 RepID=UPI0025BB3985|nr:hypothetical protein [Empedobacter sp. UBA6745]
MGKLNYRNFLIDSINSLEKAEQETFTNLLNIADNGEYSNILDAFDKGDVYEFNIKHFEDTDDQNLQSLVYLYKEIATIKHHLINLNSIKEDELDFEIEEDDEE